MARILEMVGTATAGSTTATAPDLQIVTVPAGQFWIPRSVRIALTSCAVVGNRHGGVLFNNLIQNTYANVTWLPAQAATLTRYYSAWEGATSSAAFTATSYAQASIPANLMLGPGFSVHPTDASGIAPAGRRDFTAQSISSITATTLVCSDQFGGTDNYIGYTLTLGASTAVITANTTTTLTFAGGWVGGTPGAPAAFYLEGDIWAFTMAYDVYQVMSV